jgi:hypothetical protein
VRSFLADEVIEDVVPNAVCTPDSQNVEQIAPQEARIASLSGAAEVALVPGLQEHGGNAVSGEFLLQGLDVSDQLVGVIGGAGFVLDQDRDITVDDNEDINLLVLLSHPH